MFEKLGKAKYVVPLLIGIVAACVMSVMFYPMANMEMKGLPFAVLSLDEGVQTPQGDVNVGDTLVENITSATAAEDARNRPSPGRRWAARKSWTKLSKTANTTARSSFPLISAPSRWRSSRLRRRPRSRKPRL